MVLWAGWPFFVRAVASVKNRSLNMFSLIALGTGAAWLYSIVGTVAPQLFPANLRMADGAVAIYFEAAAVELEQVVVRVLEPERVLVLLLVPTLPSHLPWTCSVARRPGKSSTRLVSQ